MIDDRLHQDRKVFRLAPGERKEQTGKDGALYRVHTFYVIDEDDSIVTDDTMDGPKPIMIQSVPMRITRPTHTGLILN